MTLIVDPVLGPVTGGCATCDRLRQTTRRLTEKHDVDESVHPNEFIAMFAQRLGHEQKTGHVVFGWRFIREAREMAKAYAAESDSATRIFWVEFMERFLVVPSGDAPKKSA